MIALELLMHTLILWVLLSALCIYGWRSLDIFLTDKGYWA